MKDESSIFDAEPENLDRLVFEILGDSGSEEDSNSAATLNGVLEQPGSQIGRYKLLSVLGEGGMGIVYLAEQQEPIRRKVALKVIKPGMDSKAVIARFEAERQALALLEHPNIAHVLDAGTTETGRPYFVMEYVKGVPITEHCDRQKLTIKERLELFLKVCEAVQHAHLNGIIHRDLKPSNVQVTIQGQQSIPKVIDFGVAKAINRLLTESTLVTEQGQFVGTPEYMSPEQAEMTGQDVDTRSDIYSLGILLYELLTGVLPFDPKTFREKGFDHIRRIIREEEPKTPSTRLSTFSGEDSTKLAQLRRTDVRTLSRQLHGDLDWITLKAMEKDRTRRYQTAHALAEDIQRYLNQEPVLAGPPSTMYKVQKFIKRNRALFISSASVATILILAVIISTQQALVARKARRAESVERKAAQDERDRAQENLYEALVREAHTTRIARDVGYRNDVFKALRQALDLEVPQKNLAELRQEATACLGDFVGLSPKRVGEFTNDRLQWVALHPHEPIVALALADGIVILRELSSLVDIARFDGKHQPVGLCFSANGELLLSLHKPKEVDAEERNVNAIARFWERDANGSWIQGRTVEVPGAVKCWSTKNGFGITVVDKESHCVELLDINSGSIVHRLEYPKRANEPPVIDISPDGRFLAAASADPNNPTSCVLDIWNLVTGKHMHRLNPELAMRTVILQFSSDAQFLAFFSGSGGTIYTTNGFRLIDRLSEHFEWQRSGVAFVPNSTIIAFSVVEQNRIRLWDWARREYVATIGREVGGSEWLHASADGRYLLTTDGRQAYAYEVGFTAERLNLSGHSASVPGISFSPDGSHLASVGKDRKLRIWNSNNGLLSGFT
jgi:serine/threonine protein kinase/WD40 repeat protein